MKIFLIILAVVVVGAVVWFVVAGTNNNANSTNTVANTTRTTNTTVNRSSNTNVRTTNANTNSALNSNSSAATNAAETNMVSITSSGFGPQTVSISAGDSVIWTNNDTSAHYIAPDDHPTHKKYAGIWDDSGAGNISPGQTYTQKFNTPGTYTYHDHLNPTTKGTVIVK